MKMIDKFKAQAVNEITGLDGVRNYIIITDDYKYVLNEEGKRPFIWKLTNDDFSPEFIDEMTLTKCLKELKELKVLK